MPGFVHRAGFGKGRRSSERWHRRQAKRIGARAPRAAAPGLRRPPPGIRRSRRAASSGRPSVRSRKGVRGHPPLLGRHRSVLRPARPRVRRRATRRGRPVPGRQTASSRNSSARTTGPWRRSAAPSATTIRPSFATRSGGRPEWRRMRIAAGSGAGGRAESGGGFVPARRRDAGAPGRTPGCFEPTFFGPTKTSWTAGTLRCRDRPGPFTRPSGPGGAGTLLRTRQG